MTQPIKSRRCVVVITGMVDTLWLLIAVAGSLLPGNALPLRTVTIPAAKTYPIENQYFGPSESTIAYHSFKTITSSSNLVYRHGFILRRT